MAIPMQQMGQVPQQMQMGSGGINLLQPYQEVLAMQTRRGCAQELLGCEAKTEFKVATKENMQNVFMYALEESSCLIRFLCPAIRPFTVLLHQGQGPEGPKIASYERPLACGPSSCKCCCFQEIKAFDTSTGQPLGNVIEDYYYFVPQFKVQRPDGSVEYLIRPPTCCGGILINPCTEGICRMPFYVVAPGAGDEQHEGKITKIWTGMATELFTDADKFEVRFPQKGPDTKARLFGALFLLNQLFFESNK